MTAVALLILSSVLWHEQFIDGVSSMKQLYDYTIDIAHEGETVVLHADLLEEEFAAAWFSIDQAHPFPDDAVMRLVVKVSSNTARVRYFCRRDGHSVYYVGATSIAAVDEWQNVDMRLQDAQPFYSSDFPASLTPGRKPALFLIIESTQPGPFTIAIDDILILEPEEEQ